METNEQLKLLNESARLFESKIAESGIFLHAVAIETIQINLGYRCNQSCSHCHVDASPTNEHQMDRETVDLCLDVIKNNPKITTVDLTGGAPEMNSNFSYLVQNSTEAGKRVIDRCNLTILEEPGYDYLYYFLSDQKVEIIASLPHFRQNYTDRQRGAGVFEKSIRALQKLNAIGYGTDIPLNLIYNPAGLLLSSQQKQLEKEFKKYLRDNYDIVFTNLYLLNNFPINRFLKALISKGKLKDYLKILYDSFNVCTLPNLMCRKQISVGYDGSLYDCDFNQMLALKAKPMDNIRNFDFNKISQRSIITANHCYACTAGSGTS